MKPVRWGILSTALIATEKVIPAMRGCSTLEVAAIASRSQPAADAAATSLGIPTAYGSYEALLADPTIEAIYNPLPNHLHVPLTLAAVRARKHVLCEKPMALRAPELDVLRPYASTVHIREAFMVRHHPQWAEVRELVRQGAIGELRYLHIPFSYFNDDPRNIRNRADIGGGALLDIGCYAVAAGRWFHEAEPERVVATIDRDPALGTDRLASGLLDSAAAAISPSRCPRKVLATSVSSSSAPRGASRSTCPSTRPRVNPRATASTAAVHSTAVVWRWSRCRRATNTSSRSRRSRAPCAWSGPTPVRWTMRRPTCG